MRARRSCLSVPATQPRFHAKADQSAADEVMLDLEDSVAPDAKERARALVVDALATYAYEGKVRAVRVNACDTRWCYEDVIQVVEGAGDRLDCIILPKVEDASHVHFASHLLDQIERKLGRTHRIGLELQIETALGLENVGAIAAASDRNETLVFGPADFAASMRQPELTVGRVNPDYPGDFWHYYLARIAVAARAHGLQPIDGPYALIRDAGGLRVAAGRAAMLGFDGKWALNPAQAEILNEVFSPSQQAFDRAVAILDTYAAAIDRDAAGAVAMDGEMIDEATRKMAEVTVERGRAIGMVPGR